MLEKEFYKIWNNKNNSLVNSLGLTSKYITDYRIKPLHDKNEVKFEIDIRNNNKYNNIDKQRLFTTCDNIIDIKRNIKKFILLQEVLEKIDKFMSKFTYCNITPSIFMKIYDKIMQIATDNNILLNVTYAYDLLGNLYNFHENNKKIYCYDCLENLCVIDKYGDDPYIFYNECIRINDCEFIGKIVK